MAEFNEVKMIGGELYHIPASRHLVFTKRVLSASIAEMVERSSSTIEMGFLWKNKEDPTKGADGWWQFATNADTAQDIFASSLDDFIQAAQDIPVTTGYMLFADEESFEIARVCMRKRIWYLGHTPRGEIVAEVRTGGMSGCAAEDTPPQYSVVFN